MSSLEVVTFDCYGTLIDWSGGAASFLYDLVRRSGDFHPPPGRELLERWEEIQFDVVSGEEYQPYSDVLGSSLRTWVAEREMRWNTTEAAAMVHAMSSWQPYPDVVPALARVREAGVRLVILSNCDRVIMDHTLCQLAPIQFADSVVAEELRVYKPDTTFFARALDRVGAAPGEILHVAGGFKYDVPPAAEMGMRTAWVNRHAETAPEGPVPDHEWRDLWGLVELVEGES